MTKQQSFSKLPKWEFRFWYHKNYFVKIPKFYKPYSMSIPLWKDKFNSPRCEVCPRFEITWLWFSAQLMRGDDAYWERWLWIHKYSDGDEQKAIETWPWRTFEKDGDDGVSTWFMYDEEKW